MLSVVLARLLTQAVLYSPMRFLWDLTAAILRNDVAPQQVTRLSIIQRMMGSEGLEVSELAVKHNAQESI